MNTILRLGSIVVLGSVGVAAQAYAANGEGQLVSPLQDAPAYLFHSSQGYLGVGIRDVNGDRVSALKLKEARGAEIVTVDHDAPACKSGLKVHDVILEMNGQPIEGVEQLRRMLRETPAGRTVAFVVSRDGKPVSVSVQLADHATVEQQAWSQHFSVPEPPPSMGFNASSRGDGSGGLMGGWSLGHGGSLVGAVVDPVGAQLASYFGVKEGVGLLVKSVKDKSPAAGAGLKAGDVVLKINQDTMTTRADWERVLRENHGKQVQLTVVRDKKEQTLTMQAGSLKKKSELDWPFPGPAPAGIEALVASAQEALAGIDPKAREEQVRNSLNGIDTGALNKQLEDLRQQLSQPMLPHIEIPAD